jgi:hypothetical protein
METMVDLKDHKKGRVYIQDKSVALRLTEKNNVNNKDVFDLSIYNNEYFDTRFWKFIDCANEENGRKIVNNSKRYKELKKVILNIYLRVFMTIVIDTLLNGDRIFMFKKTFYMHLTALPTFKKFAGKVKYKYIHDFKGVYPVLRVAISERVLYSVSIIRKVHNRVMRLDAFYKAHMSSMISHKIVNENLKLSNEWATVIRSNKINYVNRNNTPSSSRGTRRKV